jgi:hypothetical protein
MFRGRESRRLGAHLNAQRPQVVQIVGVNELGVFQSVALCAQVRKLLLDFERSLHKLADGPVTNRVESSLPSGLGQKPQDGNNLLFRVAGT